jgi:hypothetical protein
MDSDTIDPPQQRKYIEVQSDPMHSIPEAMDMPITAVNDILYGSDSTPHFKNLE